MCLETFITAVFCLTDDLIRDHRPRQRGPSPTLSDSEVLTLEVVGEFLGFDTDQDLFAYFRRHHTDLFPSLKEIERTTFTRQAANLYPVKRRLWRDLLGRIRFAPLISVIDSFPVPVCRFARAKRCKRLREVAAYGYDEMAKQTYYGLRAHVRIAWPGVIVDAQLAPANVHDTRMVPELAEASQGWLLGDRNYWDPELHAQMREQGVEMVTPFRSAKREKKRWPLVLVQKRRRIETVIGQLTERYGAKRVWAKDLGHLCVRWIRKVLSHTVAVLLCQEQGLSPLRFSELVTD